MNFAFSEEQEAFRAEIRRFVEERWPIAEVRRLMETPEGFERTIWKQMAQDLGLQGIAIAEEHGGQGFGFVELGIALEEFGRQLSGGPFLSTTCMAVPAIQRLATPEQQAEWLGQIAAGELIATLALADAGDAATRGGINVSASTRGEEFALSGHKRFVIDGQNADLILVAARDGEALGLFAVRSDAVGLDVAAVDGFDPTRKLADLVLDATPAVRVGEAGDRGSFLQECQDIASVGLAADGLGGTESCLEAGVAYAKQRMQFSRPIGSFQAIKHKAAEVLLELELARSVGYWSWWVVDSREADLGEAASIAKSMVGDGYMRASRENIQIHGGMGYTWENDAHLFYKRARSADMLGGTPTAHRLRLAEGLGFPSSGRRE
ncbi:MAG: acyl-CoA/acyl-ACP dehydrogenase [bacterium]|nr:acyl-CoA/acyl-ACP dehydrogenase [bacterium]